MDDPVIVGCLQRPCHLDRSRHGLLPREASTGLEQLLETLAAHQFHGKKWLPLILTKSQEPHDARLPQFLERLDLGLETVPHPRMVAKMGPQGFDRHSLAGRVHRLVDGAHASPAELPTDCVRSETNRVHGA